MTKSNGAKVRYGQAGPELRAKCSHYGWCSVPEGLKNFVKVCLANEALLFFLRERVFVGKSLADRGRRWKQKKRHTVLIKSLGPQENGLAVYTHMHICFPQSLTFLPSFWSPCESPFPPTPLSCLFMSHRHSFLYVSLHPSQSQHWSEAAREEKNKGNSFTIFFSILWPKEQQEPEPPAPPQ